MRIDNVQLSQAVFLDRDGTIIEDRGHLSDLADVQFVPGTIAALRRLQQEFLLFIVTNQAGVAEGRITNHDVDKVNDHLVRHLAEHGVKIAAVYVCPHRRSDRCTCIKPNPHFLNRAAKEFRHGGAQMPIVRVEVDGRQIVLHQLGGIGCATPEDSAGSTAFAEVVGLYLAMLRARNSPLLESLPLAFDHPNGISQLVTWLRAVAVSPLDQAASVVPGLSACVGGHKSLQMLAS